MNEYPLLELKNISLTTNLGETSLLDNICLKIIAQEKIGIVGASGAGKSTLLKLLNHLYSPTEGEFLYQSRSISTLEPIKLRNEIVLVPQEPKLLGMSVQKALTYPLELQKLSPSQIKHKLYQCLELFSLPESWLSRYEQELSLGQRQLISIARGVIMSPKILLLDEPTSALDSGKAQWLLDILINLKMTIVVVNHNLKWIKDFANRIVWLDKGVICQDLTTPQIDWKMIEQNLILDSDINQDFDNFQAQ